MDNVQKLLQISAKLYQHLTEIPSFEHRDDYIEKINQYLEERGPIIDTLKDNGFIYDENNQSHRMLKELDEGIKARLNKVMTSIRADLKNIQNAKKNEVQYLNPYASVQVMDGRYYDKRK